jgi:cob(I)alamin adenosyltransferase
MLLVLVAAASADLELGGPKERNLLSKWGKILGTDQLPGVHFARTDELHHEKDVATMKVSLLEEQAGPKERALESKWGKILGSGADALPGVHFARTDELHHERDVADEKVGSEKVGTKVLLQGRPLRQQAMEKKWGKILGGGADALPGVHFARTDLLHHQKDVATMKVSLLEEQAGPKERALESRWGKILGGGADALPGVHFARTDELHHERDVADEKVGSKVSFLEKAGPKERKLMSKWGKILGGGADALPGVHFARTDELHHEKDVATMRLKK